MKILSLFDGMSCGRIALDRAGIRIGKYFSSEIDKYAIQVSQKNYPDIIQQGDINNWRDWDIGEIDMVIGGSPCQGFSFAGKQLAFDDPRSKLFFTMVDIIEHYKPKYFLLENVKMKKEYQDIISEYLGVQPIEINSSLVSAQNRKRLYWANIPGVEEPYDLGVTLRDIIEDIPFDDPMWKPLEEKYLSEKGKLYLREKSLALTATYERACPRDYIRKSNRQIIVGIVQKPRGKNQGGIHEEKAQTLTSSKYQDNNILIRIGNTNPSGRGMNGEIYHVDGKSPTLTTNKGEGIKIVAPIRLGHLGSGGQGERLYSLDGKSVALSANGGGMGGQTGLYTDGYYWRKLTPLECERLQTLPDGYTEGVSNRQRYKMIGNGWTVDVISHIFSYIK